LPADVQITEPEILKDQLTPFKENLYIRNLVTGYAARFPHKVLHFEMNSPKVDVKKIELNF